MCLISSFNLQISIATWSHLIFNYTLYLNFRKHSKKNPKFTFVPFALKHISKINIFQIIHFYNTQDNIWKKITYFTSLYSSFKIFPSLKICTKRLRIKTRFHLAFRKILVCVGRGEALNKVMLIRGHKLRQQTAWSHEPHKLIVKKSQVQTFNKKKWRQM